MRTYSIVALYHLTLVLLLILSVRRCEAGNVHVSSPLNVGLTSQDGHVYNHCIFLASSVLIVFVYYRIYPNTLHDCGIETCLSMSFVLARPFVPEKHESLRESRKSCPLKMKEKKYTDAKTGPPSESASEFLRTQRQLQFILKPWGDTYDEAEVTGEKTCKDDDQYRFDVKLQDPHGSRGCIHLESRFSGPHWQQLVENDQRKVTRVGGISRLTNDSTTQNNLMTSDC